MIITQGKEIGKRGQIIQNINLFNFLIDLQGFSLHLFQCKLRFAWDQHGAVNGLDISMDGLDILICINSLALVFLLKAYILVCRACHSYRPHPLKHKGLNPEKNLWLKLVQKLPDVTVQSSKSIQQYSQKTGFQALIALYFWEMHLPVYLIKGWLKEKNKWRYKELWRSLEILRESSD